MPVAVGLVLALLVGVFGTATGLDRDRAFYPVITIIVATYYILFAVVGEASQALWPEMMIAGAFIIAAVVGFRRSLWIVVAALATHGILDLIHGSVVSNPGVPDSWPGFCMGYDVAAALYLAGLLKSGRIRAVA